MIEAYNQGIAGNGDHNWFFSDSLSPNTIPEQQYEENSPLHLATRGVFMLAAIGGLPGMKVYDTFVEKWQQLNNAEDIDYFLTNKHPQYDDLDYKTQIMNDEFFRGSTGIVAPFLYDSIIAIGLAACNISSSSNNSFFDGQMHYNQITRTQFEGTTGNIVLDPTTGTRIPESAGFELTNYVETSIQDSGDGGAMGKVTFKPSSSFLFVNGQWKQQAPPIFNDGTSTIQPDLPPLTTDYNYIGTGLRAAGLVMACVVLLLCAGFAGFTIYYRKARAVKASQPIFLLLLIGGIFLMGSSIIPLSIDDEITSAEGCTVACMAVPWLFCTGFSIAFAGK